MSQLFSKKNKEVFSAPISMNNPVTVQVLGICSALAVTAKLEPAIVMGLSVTVIVAFANVIISLLRNTIPNRIRIIVQLVVVAALVTIVLKKQKPTIPSRIIANYSDNLRCRECHMPIKYMDNYCSYCGQKIDAQL